MKLNDQQKQMAMMQASPSYAKHPETFYLEMRALETPVTEVVAPAEHGALIERVARALCRFAHADRDESERVSPSRQLWMRFIQEAEVALQAMRDEPQGQR